jgi:hypothetical protein
MKIFLLVILLFLPLCAGAQDIPLLIKQEIAKTPNGEFLYKHSDAFRRTIEFLIAKKLGLREDVFSKTSAEKPLATGGNYIDVSNDDFAQQETSVAISRTDPHTIVIGSNDDAMDVRSMPVYTSTDGGVNWNTYRIPQVPEPYIPLGDPVMLADNTGGFFYAFLLYNEGAGLYDLLVTRSADGKNWTYTAPIIVNPVAGDLEDKPSMAIDRDPASPYYNRVYLSWLHIGPIFDSCYLNISYSDDHGISWSAPHVAVKDVGYFAQLKVGKGGKVFFAYSDYTEEDIPVLHHFYSSSDGGKTFLPKHTFTFYFYPYQLGPGMTTLKGPNGFRAFPYMTYDYDLAGGAIDLAYCSYGFAEDKRAAQIFYIRSTDEGGSWSSPKALGYLTDSSTLTFDRFQPWLVTDAANGRSYLFYLSSQRDPANLLTSAYLERIGKDLSGLSLTDSVFNPLQVRNFLGNVFIGDYTGADVHQNVFASAWTENRERAEDGEIYAFISNNVDSLQSGIKQIQVSAKKLSIVSLYPNPSVNGTITVSLAIPHSADVRVTLNDITGREASILLREEMEEGVHTKEFSLKNIAGGIYFLTLESAGEKVVRKIVVTGE